MTKRISSKASEAKVTSEEARKGQLGPEKGLKLEARLATICLYLMMLCKLYRILEYLEGLNPKGSLATVDYFN